MCTVKVYLNGDKFVGFENEIPVNPRSINFHIIKQLQKNVGSVCHKLTDITPHYICKYFRDVLRVVRLSYLPEVIPRRENLRFYNAFPQ